MQKAVRVRGFIRGELINIKTKKRVRGKWHENTVTADGFQNYIVGPIGAVAGSKTIGFLQVASQTAAPTSAQTSATGEFEARKATTNTFSANGTLQMTASFATNEATQSNLGGAALYNTSSGGTCASVATFATSAKTTDQTFNITWQWRFS